MKGRGHGLLGMLRQGLQRDLIRRDAFGPGEAEAEEVGQPPEGARGARPAVCGG